MSQQLEHQVRGLPHTDIPTAQLHAGADNTRTEGAAATVQAERGRCRTRQARRPRPWRVGVLGLTALTVSVLLWQWHQPRAVTVVQPPLTTITESLVTTGRVSGTIETFVGTQATGIIDRLLVREGDRVSAGEPLAILKNNVAEAQVAQAQAALNTARAQFAQGTRAPLRSDVEIAAEHVRQARAQWAQQRTAAVQAEHAVAQARAQFHQLEAEQELAVKQYARSARLVARGFIAQTEFDQTQANRRVAEGKVWAQQQALAAAHANVRALQAGIEAAHANVRAQEAQLQTVQTGPRPEDIQVAWARVEEAEHALHVAR